MEEPCVLGFCNVDFYLVDRVFSIVLLASSAMTILGHQLALPMLIKPWYCDLRYPLLPNRLNSKYTVIFMYTLVVCYFGNSFRGKLTVLLLFVQVTLNYLIYKPFDDEDRPHLIAITTYFRFNRFYYITMVIRAMFTSVLAEEDPRSNIFLVGLALFVTGFAMKCHYDHHFIRGDASDFLSPSHGHLFHYMTCPHFFSRMLEWLGIALISGQSIVWSYAMFMITLNYVNAQNWHRLFETVNSEALHGRTAFFSGEYYEGDDED